MYACAMLKKKSLIWFNFSKFKKNPFFGFFFSAVVWNNIWHVVGCVRYWITNAFKIRLSAFTKGRSYWHYQYIDWNWTQLIFTNKKKISLHFFLPFLCLFPFWLSFFFSSSLISRDSHIFGSRQRFHDLNKFCLVIVTNGKASKIYIPLWLVLN